MLRELARAAEPTGVKIGFEGSLFYLLGLGGQAELVRMVDEVNSPALKIYVHPHGDTAAQVQAIDEVGERICALHASTIDPEVDYGQVFAALKRVNYDWYWCFEVADDQFASSVTGFHALAAKFGA
jgi:sugar phosphate isomerase/epimerase